MHKRKTHDTNTRKRTLCSKFPHRSSLIPTYGVTCTSNFRTASKRGELTSRRYANSSQHEARSGWHRSQWLTGMGGGVAFRRSLSSGMIRRRFGRTSLTGEALNEEAKAA